MEVMEDREIARWTYFFKSSCNAWIRIRDFDGRICLTIGDTCIPVRACSTRLVRAWACSTLCSIHRNIWVCHIAVIWHNVVEHHWIELSLYVKFWIRLDTKSTILLMGQRCRSMRIISRRPRDVYSIRSSPIAHDRRMYSATSLFISIHTIYDKRGHDWFLQP